MAPTASVRNKGLPPSAFSNCGYNAEVLGKEGSRRIQVRSITAAKAQRGGHDGAGWPEARAWDRVADLADILADGDSRKSAEGSLGGSISVWKSGPPVWSRLADVPGRSAAAIESRDARSWPPNARRKWPRHPRICDAVPCDMALGSATQHRAKTASGNSRLSCLTKESEPRSYRPPLPRQRKQAKASASTHRNSDF